MSRAFVAAHAALVSYSAVTVSACLLYLHHYTIIGFTSSPSPIWDPAEICFEPYPDNPIRVTEMQRSMCVSVVRDVGDPDVFQYRAVSIANLDADRAALGMRIYIATAISRNLSYSQ